jgi:uncharacterized small protein (DUF1192 family)
MNENKIPLKTDEEYFNKDNFVQTDDCMEELTVEITLAEYRSLIRNDAYQAVRITELKSQLAAAQADNERLKAQLSIANGTNG